MTLRNGSRRFGPELGQGHGLGFRCGSPRLHHRDSIDLRSGGGDDRAGAAVAAGGRLPAAYEAGAVAAVEYATAALPPEPAIRADLRRMFDLYEDAIAAKRRVLVTDPGAIMTPGSDTATGSGTGETFDHFKPK